jgi:glucoamylase
VELRGNRVAFGGPGISPRWSHSNKDGVGTAYSADSRLWYTLWRGIVTEVYFPRIDRPQLRDLQFLLTDGETFFHEEKRHLRAVTERPTDHALGYRVTSDDPEGRYRVHKSVIGDPHLPCLLVHTRLELTDPELARRLRLFVLAAPHLDVGGWGNNAAVYDVLGQSVLAAERNGVALALASTRPFLRSSVGYVGASDGWTDVSSHRTLSWEFDRAPNGNVALTGEVPLTAQTEFTLGLAFGESVPAAVTALFQSLSTPFEVHRRRFVEQWKRPAMHELPLGKVAHDGGRLYRASRSILLAHEDKVYPGAFIASLSIPWGASRGDEEPGGYHLVWTRDMVHTATALLASGNVEAPLRALVYLATRQRPDGGFPQNFWLDGTPYWQGMQLDEVALPILLAGRLKAANVLEQFDPHPMVRRAARFLIEHGPVTAEDRWEEVGGYSPSTLATSIAGLSVAARFTDRRADATTARFIQEYADFLESHVDPWTVTTRGTLVRGIPRHYVRVRPASVDDPEPDEGPDLGSIRLPNLPPGTADVFPASEIVDTGFLDLVRYGVRRADHPLVLDSVKVADETLRVTTPFGPVWRRYNHDGYGQRDDGGPYANWGVGRAWPMLTGERGHYELALGRDPGPYLRAMERFATSTGLLTEQVWDAEDQPALHLELGRPTEAAMPLVWAHAEYVTLLRSTADGAVFDRIPEVTDRYILDRPARRPLEVWKFNRRPRSVDPSATLRVVANQPFRLHGSDDDWRTARDLDSEETGLGLHFADLAPLGGAGRRWTFTFYWPLADRWEGRDFRVAAAIPGENDVTPP